MAQQGGQPGQVPPGAMGSPMGDALQQFSPNQSVALANQQAAQQGVPPGWTPMGAGAQNPNWAGGVQSWSAGQPPPGGAIPNPQMPPGQVPPDVMQQMFQNQVLRAPQSLGLGLGLNAGQRQGFMNAAQGGQGQDWLAQHPGIQQRIERRVKPGSAQEGRIQRFTATGTPQR